MNWCDVIDHMKALDSEIEITLVSNPGVAHQAIIFARDTSSKSWSLTKTHDWPALKFSDPLEAATKIKGFIDQLREIRRLSEAKSAPSGQTSGSKVWFG